MEALERFATWLKLDGELLPYGVLFALFAVLSAIETVHPPFEQAPERQRRWPANIGLGLVNVFLPPWLPISIFWAAEWAHDNHVGVLNAVSWPDWISVLCSVALINLTDYVIHVLLHKVPLFWRLHRVHHLDTHLDVSTAVRSHPGELVLVLLITLPVVIALGITPWVLVLYKLAEAVMSALTHANMRLPRHVDRVLVTPNMHAIHHSSYQPETDSNYSSVFPVWDRLFGTHTRMPKRGYDRMQVGLKEVRDARASDLWWQITSPMHRTLRHSGMGNDHLWAKTQVSANDPAASEGRT
ncbi:sterol desaturase family protein [Microvirga arabica]|uniref:sterol desaturase family protein n=1 Tax=Microvirga arabica TaxID=1128671 RepID=UPI0019392751|nr:sterol desaturase family protein [Microvirga arabica]MBM1175469.1 sterol desaturase family protein [Microvirga arabica]